VLQFDLAPAKTAALLAAVSKCRALIK
jgi:hypothetical protein